MNMLVRLLVLGLRTRLRDRVDSLGTCRTPFRVLPTDLDLLGHMNNGVYFSIFDLARMDLMRRSGLLGKFREQGWYPVVTAETASFRRSLEPFRRFTVDTRIIGWDERHIYLEHRVASGEKPTTAAVIQIRFLSRSGERITPQQLLDLLPGEIEHPELPEWVEQWGKSAFEHATERPRMAA